jgi:hypothetical protein
LKAASLSVGGLRQVALTYGGTAAASAGHDSVNGPNGTPSRSSGMNAAISKVIEGSEQNNLSLSCSFNARARFVSARIHALCLQPVGQMKEALERHTAFAHTFRAVKRAQHSMCLYMAIQVGKQYMIRRERMGYTR